MNIFMSSHGHSIHYYTYGNGEKVLITFHGFGQNGQDFREYETILDDAYTIIAVDLFFHGKSTYSGCHKYLTNDLWYSVFEEFQTELGFRKYSVVAFSLGARFALSLFVQSPSNIDQLILLAPDGIKVNIWYEFATSPAFQWLFKYFMKRPEKLQPFMKFLSRLKLVKKSQLKFTSTQIRNSKRCMMIYDSWVTFKKLKYPFNHLKQTCQNNPDKVHIILGNKDNILGPNQLLPMTKKLKNCQIHSVSCNHHRMISGSKTHIEDLLMR